MNWKSILQQALAEGQWSFARSSGPGGQNVNKVETKAIWRWEIAISHLPEELRTLAYLRLGTQLTKNGDLVVASDRYRDRERNKADCVEKVKALFSRAFYIKPMRKKTKPSRAQKQKRLESKKRQSAKKSLRGKVYDAP